jgi:exodeoxyribonuclease-3
MPTRTRERNVGWRIDYFFVTVEMLDRGTDAFILPDVIRNDQCPVGLALRETEEK